MQYSAGMSLTKHNKQTHSQFSKMPFQSWYQENLRTNTVHFYSNSTDKNLTWNFYLNMFFCGGGLKWKF